MITNFVLFSSEYKLAQKLLTLGNLLAIYVESKHFNQDIYNLSKLNNIPLCLVRDINELSGAMPNNYKNAVGISYAHGLKFRNEHINIFEHGIWNIHTGKLPDNRGRHPIAWSFMNNDRKFFISVHSINEEIDMGSLLYESYVYRDINDTTDDIMIKLVEKIEGNLIEEAIKNYLKNNKQVLNKGIYYPRFDRQYQEINSKELDAIAIYNLFKSQIVYGKIKVDGTFYSNCNLYHPMLTYPEKSVIIQTKTDKIVLD